MIKFCHLHNDNQHGLLNCMILMLYFQKNRMLSAFLNNDIQNDFVHFVFCKAVDCVNRHILLSADEKL